MNGLVPGPLSSSSHVVLQAFLVMNGLFPSKGSVCKLVSGHACCISQNPSTVGVPPLCSSYSENRASVTGMVLVRGSGRRRGMLRGVYKSVFVTLH